MTSPLAGGLVGFARSNKDIDFGWARGRADEEGGLEQFFERLTRNLRQLDAGIQHQWAWNPRQTLDLEYAHFGGIVDSGAAWVIVPDGVVTLAPSAVNFVERVAVSGVVQVNQLGFTYPDAIPMAEVTTRNGQISDYLDRRPELGEASVTGAGCTDFSCLTGIAVRTQLPPEIAYEDEANIFTVPNDFRAGIKTDTIAESTADAGTTVEGVEFIDGTAPLLEDLALFWSR